MKDNDNDMIINIIIIYTKRIAFKVNINYVKYEYINKINTIIGLNEYSVVILMQMTKMLF